MPCVAIWPKTVRTSVLEVLWFAPDCGGAPRDPSWETRIANFDRIVDEDIEFVERMQHTIEAPGFLGVPLSYQERYIHHWREEVDRCIGVATVPPALRVASRLAVWIE
jgi:hypothetical protein